MTTESPLKDKTVLIVDDEPDILETVGELLDMCALHKAGDYDTAVQYLSNNSYDIVVLDIMGVKGFELLKISESKGFPTVMLTAHAVTPEALKRSMDMGGRLIYPQGQDDRTERLTGRRCSGWRQAFVVAQLS